MYIYIYIKRQYKTYFTYGKRKGAYGVLVENLYRTDRQYLEDLGLDWRIMFKWILKACVRLRTGFM
jgi:hypothetical protein